MSLWGVLGSFVVAIVAGLGTLLGLRRRERKSSAQIPGVERAIEKAQQMERKQRTKERKQELKQAIADPEPTKADHEAEAEKLDDLEARLKAARRP